MRTDANRYNGSGKAVPMAPIRAKEMNRKPLATDVLEQSPIQALTRENFT
jgi:hypothetical protein